MTYIYTYICMYALYIFWGLNCGTRTFQTLRTLRFLRPNSVTLYHPWNAININLHKKEKQERNIHARMSIITNYFILDTLLYGNGHAHTVLYLPICKQVRIWHVLFWIPHAISDSCICVYFLLRFVRCASVNMYGICLCIERFATPSPHACCRTCVYVLGVCVCAPV